MSNLLFFVFFSILASHGFTLVQNIQTKMVGFFKNTSKWDEIGIINKLTNIGSESSTSKRQLQESHSGQGFGILSKSKNETKRESLKFEVPKVDLNNNQTLQSKLPNKHLPIHREALQDEVEMDEKIYLTFSEKERRDGFKRTSPEENPFAVLIVVVTEYSTKASLCSGSILTPRWVLTAAHCFTPDVSKVYVYAGGSSFAEFQEFEMPRSSQLRETHAYYVHPQYKRSVMMMFDVAVVKVKKAFKMTSTVSTVKLGNNSIWTHDSYKMCVMTGFGSLYLNKEDPEDRTRKTHYFEAKPHCPCLEGTPEGDVLICSRPKEDYGVCTGDSGGGLICNGVVVAVASTVVMYSDIDNCTSVEQQTDCGLKNSLSTFQQTEPYLDWINSKLNKASADRGNLLLVTVVVVFPFLVLQNSLTKRQILISKLV